ncbi:hypothetical protein QOT17_021666 [Balamuthia mandrillaris]
MAFSGATPMSCGTQAFVPLDGVLCCDPVCRMSSVMTQHSPYTILRTPSTEEMKAERRDNTKSRSSKPALKRRFPLIYQTVLGREESDMENKREDAPPLHLPFLELPSELQLNMLARLVSDTHGGGNELFHCHLVCKRFLEILKEEHFWQTVLQMLGVVDGCSALPDDVQSWKQLYQLEYIHLETTKDNKDLLRLDDRKRTVTLTGTHEWHTRVYSSRDWYSGRHYWEVAMDHLDDQIYVGVLPSDDCFDDCGGIIGDKYQPGWSITPFTGEVIGNYGQDQTQPPKDFEWFKSGDIIGICLDIDSGLFCFVLLLLGFVFCFLPTTKPQEDWITGRMEST